MSFRSILDWISGRQTPVLPSAAIDAQERRRFLRMNLADGTVTIGKFPAQAIVNLSFGGLRFRLPDVPGADQAFSLGTTIPGHLQLGQIRLDVNLKVCNRGPDEVGCSYQDFSPAQSRLLSEFLKPRLLGGSLQEVTGARLKSPHPNLRLRWFQGDDNVQVYLWQTLDGEIVKEEFYFLDYVIAWNREGDTLTTARLKENLTKSGFGRLDQQSAAFFRVPSHRAIRMGNSILRASSLPPEARDLFLARLVQEEKRLYSRYLVDQHQDGVYVQFPPQNARFPVFNLSLRGLALLPQEAFPKEFTQLGAQSDGLLELGSQAIPVSLRVVYHREGVLGTTLDIHGEDHLEVLAGFLAPRLLSQSLEEQEAPLEELPPVPSGSRSYLFIGVHNTHLLSVIAPDKSLVLGRLAFMDELLISERGKLQAFSCRQGIVFPRDWDIPAGILERKKLVSQRVAEITRQMLSNPTIPLEVKQAWEKQLAG